MLVQKLNVQLKIDKEDLGQYESRGFKAVGLYTEPGADVPKPLEQMTVPELKTYAEKKGIDIADLKLKDDIYNAILKDLEEIEDTEPEGE